MEEFLADLRTRLGLDAEATVEAVLAALDEKIAEQATTVPPAGTVLIDQGVLAALQSDAAAGRKALDAQVTAHRDGIIADALRDGKITKFSAKTFREALDANEAGTAAILATLAPNTVPVTELGVGSVDAADAEYDRYFPKES